MTTSTSKEPATTGRGEQPLLPPGEQHNGLLLAPDFALPRNAVRKRLAIIASSGAGKSYLSMVMIERMVEDGHPVVVIDPLGVYWGLRSSADGTGAGLPLLIFGGPRGDLPLDATAGNLMAELLVELRRPAILDLSLFANTRQACLFVAAFLNGLRRYEKPKLHLVIDESDLFAPQTPKSPEAQLSYDAMDNLARRDRVKGLGATFITQRPAKLAKDVLSQVEALISLRLGGPHDIKALHAWFELHATPEQLAEYKRTVLTLPTGTAWVWSPAWLQVFRQVQVQGRTTFDSSATPDVDESEPLPTHLAPLDLASLGERMKALTEQASEDASVLKTKIAHLEEALRQERAGKQRESSPGQRTQRREHGETPPVIGRPAALAGTSIEAFHRQLTEAERAKERLTAENQTLREQVALLSQLNVTMNPADVSSLVTLPTTLPVAEAIIEHVHFGPRKESSILLPPQASAELAVQMEQRQERLSTLEQELVQKDALIARLRAEVSQRTARTAREALPQRARPSAAPAPPLPVPPAAKLTGSQEVLVRELIDQVNALSRFQRQLFRLLLTHEQEVTMPEIATRLHKTMASVSNFRATQLKGLQLVMRTENGYQSALTAFCQHRLMHAPVAVVRDRLLHAVQR